MILRYVFFLVQSCGLIFTAGSCNKQHTALAVLQPETDTTVNHSADSASKSFLALGDSYTIGASVQPQERFPAQTAMLLRNHGYQIKEVEYIATSGWTTLNLQAAINEKNPKGTYDIVTLLIGVNDQYQTGGDTTGYRQRFTALLQKSIQLAGNDTAHVFVLSIPDYSVTPFASGSDTAFISRSIDQFNHINRQVTESYGVSYTDITPYTRMAKTDASLLAADGLHPSGKEYAVWAGLLQPTIEKVLEK